MRSALVRAGASAAHVRFATFDGDQLAYRFRVIGMESGGTVRLVEFAIIE
jgi:hypothetical protein